MKYGFDDIGGFYAFTDDDAGYAYPSSQHAIEARKNPERTAKAMLRGDLAQLRRVNHVAAEIYYAHVTAKHTAA